MARGAQAVALGLLTPTVLGFPSQAQPPKRETNDTDMVYSFKDIPKSAELQWTPCYDRFKCANLEVPLDYANPEVGTTVVAYIRQNAVNGTGQDILFNPGGPGGSGIGEALEGFGDTFIKHVGGQYNFVTFDPRGVNNSGIALTCYPENRGLAASIQIDQNGSPYEQYSMAVAIGQHCTEANNDTLVKYAGTSAVVQDMMHFTSLQASLNGDQNPQEAKIWYYGVSYGTVIGQTLAAMYPERVGRVMVDGNVNSEEYYTGYSTRSFEDTDEAFEWFFALCAEAGPQRCAFAGNTSNAVDVKARFDTLLVNLDLDPVIYTEPVPGVVTQTMLLSVIHHMLYTPMRTFPVLAEILVGLEQNNASILIENSLGASQEAADDDTASTPDEGYELITSIDTSGRSVIKSADDYIRMRNRLQLQSAYDGLVLGFKEILTTTGMGIIPPESQYFYGFNKTSTASPILFLSTVGDPITPAGSAVHMAGYFEGSAVLRQNSTGHSTFGVPSSCVTRHLHAYLSNATMPSVGTMCQPDFQPFGDVSDD